MGAIIDIDAFLNTLKQQGIKVVYCDHFRPMEQKGQSCKLAAGAIVQHYLYERRLNSQQPLPLYKNKHTNKHAHSLREYAKATIGSVVGEVYGPEQVQKVYGDKGYSAQCYRINNEKRYAEFIVDLLSLNQPVIAFFDVGFNKGELSQRGVPKLYQGMHEHGAAIVGYFYDANNQMQLIYSQWNGFFTASLKDIFHSSEQLSKDKKPETFYKYAVPIFRPEVAWTNPEQTDHNMEIYYKSSCMKVAAKSYTGLCRYFGTWGVRQSNPPKGLEGSLSSVLCVIQGDKQALPMLDMYKEFECLNEETKRYKL